MGEETTPDPWQWAKDAGDLRQWLQEKHPEVWAAWRDHMVRAMSPPARQASPDDTP